MRKITGFHGIKLKLLKALLTAGRMNWVGMLKFVINATRRISGITPVKTEYVQNVLLLTEKDGWINKEWISSNIKKSDLDVRYVNKFLGLLSLEIWYRLFITKEMNSKTTLS